MNPLKAIYDAYKGYTRNSKPISESVSPLTDAGDGSSLAPRTEADGEQLASGDEERLKSPQKENKE